MVSGRASSAFDLQELWAQQPDTQKNSTPELLTIFDGAKMRAIQNLDLNVGLVNGAVGRAVACDHAPALVILVQWPNGTVSPIWQWAANFEACLCSPARLCRSAPSAGAELAETLHFFEDSAPPGWSYTAWTRATNLQSLRVIGWPGPRHFRARGKRELKRRLGPPSAGRYTASSHVFN